MSTLYRGHRQDTGEWVYGHLVDKDYILRYIDLAESWEPGTSDHRLVVRAFEVKPGTVGQYTGLKDKNGKDIYEGDILRVADKLLRVVFEDGCFYNVWQTSRYRVGGWALEAVEVVGNIYQNKELLHETP